MDIGKLDVIRTILGLKPILHTFNEQKFATATLIDGTKVETAEGQELVVGSTLYVVAEDGSKQLAPVGAHQTENAEIVVDSNGQILTITEKQALEEVEIEVGEKKEEEAPADIVDLVKKIIEENYGDFKKVKEAMEMMLNEVQLLKEDLGKMKNKYSEFENTPAAEPVSRSIFGAMKDTEDVVEKRLQMIKKHTELFAKN
jgi:hypothetical protein